jgi:peptide/nickel transport system permease protein
MAERFSMRRELKRNPLAAAGVVLVVVFVAFALFAPWLAPKDPAYNDLAGRDT